MGSLESRSFRTIAYECRHFVGDRPCVWHKRSGVLCPCAHLSEVKERVLLIKLDAMGDVLRTTALLPALSEVHPDASIVWVTRPESRPLLVGNPYVTEIIDYGPDALAHLQAREFDRVINLDAGKLSCALASVARAPRKDGFVLDSRGYVTATNQAALAWLQMGIFDDLKRAGTRTYQDVMAEILGLTGREHRYVFQLNEDERSRGRAHLAALGVVPDRPVVGLNTGAGGRWPLKQWREDGYVRLVEDLAGEAAVQFVLLGGPGERERNERLKAGSAVRLFDPGCENSVRHFASLVAACDVVITGDTLAMHLALALERRTVVLFGPTSAPEIEMYGLGEKVIPDIGCVSCYRQACDKSPNCMDLVSKDAVAAAVERQLGIARPAAAFRGKA